MENEKKLSSVQWLKMFAGCVLLIFILVIAMNVTVDPYGAFGDRIFKWWSYDETLNPRMAKISYLEQHHDEYDSYIIGSSGTSSYPIDELNSYMDASFFNCFFYGTDMGSYEEICDYLISNYTVKNLVLNLNPEIGAEYGQEKEIDRTSVQHYKVSGENPLRFFGRYMLGNPMDSVQKIRYLFTDGYLQEDYRVFSAENGSYDKSRRDAEPVSDLDSYLNNDRYSVFLDYPEGDIKIRAMDEAAASVGRIVEKCNENNIRLIVTVQPAYYKASEFFSEEDQAAFRNALAQVTDYWDFSKSSVSYDPRYFYDETHFRNDVGRMALARIFGDDSRYVPDDFGDYVSKGSQPGVLEFTSRDASSYSTEVPILVYHDITEGAPENDSQMNYERFREHMEALKNSGYTPVSFDDLKNYVTSGYELPEKPVVITFDDGYESNYSLAYPVLQEYGSKATVFAIGCSIGKDTYKDTGEPMNRHFTLEQAQEMTDSGLITIASHGYDIHEVEGRDPEPIRKGVLRKDNESESEYVEFLENDCAAMKDIEGIRSDILSYPYGYCDELSEVIVREQGIWATVTTEEKTNVIVKGLEQSLRQMGRFYMTSNITADQLISLISKSSVSIDS